MCWKRPLWDILRECDAAQVNVSAHWSHLKISTLTYEDSFRISHRRLLRSLTPFTQEVFLQRLLKQCRPIYRSLGKKGAYNWFLSTFSWRALLLAYCFHEYYSLFFLHIVEIEGCHPYLETLLIYDIYFILSFFFYKSIRAFMATFVCLLSWTICWTVQTKWVSSLFYIHWAASKLQRERNR